MPFKKGAHSVVALAAFLLLTVTEELHGTDTHTDELHGINNKGCLHDANNEKTNQLQHILPLIYANVQSSANGNGLVINNKAKYKWICHTDDNSVNVQYITLYNIQDNLPVYSAYKASPAYRGTLGPALKRPGWKDPNPSAINNKVLPTDDDYKLGPASLIDRGHLFAAAYASADQAQFKSTFKITNVVAQDSIFNRKVWSQAERILKAVGMKECLGMTNKAGQSGIPVVVTGAVPENLKADPIYQPYYSVRPINPITKEPIVGRNRFKVPVLMWTTMWCMNIGFHVSFIGANSPLGEVKFYRNFKVFEQELAGMYGIGNPWLGKTTPDKNEKVERLIGQEFVGQDGRISWAINKQQVWMSGFRAQRINFLETLLYDNFFQMDIQLDSIGITGVRGINRKRRSTSPTAVQTNTTFTLVEIKDQDPDSDFKLTECSVVEKINEKGKTQSHTIDMDKNKLIESSDPTGSKITGSYQGKDGIVKEMKKEQSKEKTISIVLSPRTP